MSTRSPVWAPAKGTHSQCLPGGRLGGCPPQPRVGVAGRTGTPGRTAGACHQPCPPGGVSVLPPPGAPGQVPLGGVLISDPRHPSGVGGLHTPSRGPGLGEGPARRTTVVTGCSEPGPAQGLRGLAALARRPVPGRGGGGGPRWGPTRELEVLPSEPTGRGAAGVQGRGREACRPACCAPGHQAGFRQPLLSRTPPPPPAGSYTMSPRSKGTAEFKRRKTVG